jgi:phospholipase/carboxylesterase
MKIGNPIVSVSNPENIKTMVLMLHGYGSNANDLISLVPELKSGADGLVFLSVNAPFQFEGGVPGAYQWYSLMDRSTPAMMSGYNKAAAILDAFIAEQLQHYSLEYKDLVLLGFSQGAMMTLHYGTQCEHKLKGLIAFSGFILDEGNFASEVRNKPDVLICHGISDVVVPPQSFDYAVEKLNELDFSVDSCLLSGLGHGIDYRAISAATGFLSRICRT